MASRPLEFQPTKTCQTCGKNDLMTSEALRQHVIDKEDSYHKCHDCYPVVCACGKRFMTPKEMWTHHGAEGPLNMNVHIQERGDPTQAARSNVGHEYLKKSLDEYFAQHVKLDQEEMRQATNVAKEISNHLLDKLKTRFEFKKLNLAQIEPVGSSFDGLKVAPADEFDMIIPINLYSYDWELIDGREAVVEGRQLYGAQGFWLIKKTTSRETNMDPYLSRKDDGDYIAPGNIIRDLQRKVHKIIRKFKNPEGVVSVRGGVKGPSMYMQVEYTTSSGDKKKFDLDFVLEVRVGDAPDIPKLVAKRHPSITQQGFLGDNPMALLWQESSAKKESEKIRSIREESSIDCRKKCWKLVKALAMKNKHLGSLCTYFYKTLFLHLLDNIPDNADWYDAKLADRFLDVFKKMEKVLHRKWMPLYYTRDVNMLLPRYNEMQVENVYYYVRKMNVEGSHMQLLYGGPSSAVKKKEKEYTVFSKLRKVKAPAVKAAAQPNKTTNPKPRKRKSAPPKKRPAKPASKKPAKAKAPKAQVRPTFVDLDFEIDLDMDDFGADYDDYNDYGGYGGYQDDFF